MSLFSKSRTRRDAQRRVSEAPERAAPTPRRAVDDPFDLDFISQIPIKVYTEREGLPSQFVQALAFDVGGRLWAGTGLGVAQYNGRVWTELPLPEQAMSKQVRSLCAARDRSLWVGTQAGLLRYANGGWRTLGSSAGLDLAGVRARSILETDGVGGSGCEIWVATDHGIARLSNKGWSAFDTGSGLPPENVWTLSTAHDERGKPTVLAGTETGIARFDASRERWSPIASADSCEILGSGVQCLLETTDERGARVLWVGTHGGLARFADGRWSVVDLSPAMTTPEVYALAETADADGARVFWMGTRNDGLARSSRGRWRAWKGGGSGTIGTQVWCLIDGSRRNRSRGLWVGTSSGVVRLDGGSWRALDLSAHLSDRAVGEIVEIEGETGSKALWVGSTSAGAAKLEGGRWTTFDTTSGLPNNEVTHITETGGPAGPKAVWIATAAGLVRYADGTLTAVEGTTGSSSMLVRAIEELPATGDDRTVWILTAQGLGRLEGDRFVPYRLAPDLAAWFTCMTATTTASGQRVLWLGSYGGGLMRLSDPPDGQAQIIRAGSNGFPSDEIHSMRQFDEADGKRTLWVATTRGLAWRDLDDETGPWSTLNTGSSPRLPGETAYGIERDASGRYYVMTNKGVVRLEGWSSKSGGSGTMTQTFGIEDGLPGIDGVFGRSSTVDSLGRVWFGTVEGPAVFDPTLEVEDRAPKPLAIEAVRVDGEVCDLGIREPLSWQVNTLEFEFALLSYFRETETRYRSQLVGFDREPSEWKGECRRTYTNLGAGSYTFRVWGRDYAGNVTGPVDVAFRIKPAPWKTWWAYTVYAGAAAGAAYAGVRYRLDSLERRSRELEALVAQRTAELSESEQRALEANRSKSTFLANMSHELRTPLNAVLGFAQLLERRATLNDEDREHLEIIRRSGEHLLGLVNDVLSIAKIEAGRLALVEQPFDLGQLLEAVERIAGVRAEAKGLALVVSVEPGLPAAVRGDEGKLRQVLLNLLGNAVKFTEGGRVVLRARWKDGRAAFEVEDTGHGIADEELGKLFQTFSQTESGRASNEGTGLGLVISRQIVRMMGGDISVESRLGEGTTFRLEVELPECEGVVRAEQARRVVGIAASGRGEAPPRLLVVDDTAENRRLLVRLLGSVGFDVREAANGRDAIDEWEAWRPALILMDVRMPVMNGREAAQRIRTLEAERPGRPRTVIVALTASAFEHERDAILECGVDDFVTKPFREATIFEVLAAHLGIHFLYEEIAESPARADTSPLTPERIAALPAELARALSEAIVVGDLEAGACAAEAIRAVDEPLAAALLAEIQSFRVDELFSLLGRVEPN